MKKIKNHHILGRKYKNVNNLHGWSMSQRLPVSDFKWVDEPS